MRTVGTTKVKILPYTDLAKLIRESSFNMTGGGGGDEDIEGGLQKFLDTQKGGSENITGGLQKFVYMYFKPKRRGGS